MAAAMILGIGTFLPCHSAAQTSDQTSIDESWQFRASIYGYLPSIASATMFPGPGSSLNVSASDIINHLKFTFMGAFDAQKGPWGAFTDIIYLNAGGAKSGTRDLVIPNVPYPVGVNANANLDIKAVVWTIAPTYQVLSMPHASLQLLMGARLLNLNETLDWGFNADIGPFVGPTRIGSSERTLTNWDGVIGFKGRINFGSRQQWFIPYYGDLGTGASAFTGQALVGAGYSWHLVEVVAAWRYLRYRFGGSGAIENLTLNGPLVGVTFRF
jgi:hypothetical protein